MTLARASEGICSRQALSQFECGRARPMWGTLISIAARVGVDQETLLASPHDPRERSMRELEERSRWDELERLASKVLADLNVTPRMRAVAGFYRGRSLVDRDPHEAREALRSVRGHLLRVAEPWLAAEARDWEGVALYYLQDPASLDTVHSALASYRGLAGADPSVEARMLEHIGSILLQRQEIGQALQFYHRAIDVGGQVVNLARLASIYHGIASGCLRSGDTRRALDCFERAVSLSRVHHDVLGITSAGLARLENDFGGLLLREGQLDRAGDLIRSALDHFAAAEVEAGRSHALLSMGELEYQRGELAAAEDWIVQAIALAERLGEGLSEATAYQQLGELRAAQGRQSAVDGCFFRAFELLAKLDLPERAVEARARHQRLTTLPEAIRGTA